MRYKRDISSSIERLIRQFPILVLTGARQVGKTTLLKSLFPTYNYVSLDLPSLAEAAETEPQNFLSQYPAPLIIDEVQYAPRLFRSLKETVDRDRHLMGRYILTGSQKFSLMKEVSESLAGRAGLLELETLNLNEIGTQRDWLRLLARGLYPELWRQPEMNPADFFSSYVATYLERDVRQILNVASLRDFERLLRAAAVRSGQLLNRTDLARDVGVAPKTVGEWISVLQASNQIFLLEPYFGNIGKRLVKSPKLYFHDPGLLCFLLGLDESSLPNSPLLGSIWETFVYAELRKRGAQGRSAVSSIWFYRDAQGRELDFLRLNHGRMDLLECKWTESPSLRAIQHFEHVAKQIEKSGSHPKGESFVVCRSPSPFAQAGVKVVDPNSIPF